MRSPGTDRLLSVDRALSLLELLAESESMTVTQLAARLGTSKTTAFRLASSLLARGWLVKEDDLRYRLGPGALGLGAQSDRGEEQRVALRPILGDLHEETKETVQLTRLEGRYVVYLDQLVSPRPVRSLATLGSRAPAHCVSSGLAQLAALPDSRLDRMLRVPFARHTDATVTDPDALRRELRLVRERGYAVNHGAFRQDVGGVGVAVTGVADEPIVGIAVCMPVYRMTEHDLDALGRRLVTASHEAAELVRPGPPR